MDWQAVQEWFLGLGAQYGVNPLIFGAIYVGAIPFFTLSVARLIQQYRRGRSLAGPALSAAFFFVSAYLYLLVAGRNIPVWVYGVVVGMIVFGGYTTVQKIRHKVKEA